jgi:hypothetical protein
MYFVVSMQFYSYCVSGVRCDAVQLSSARRDSFLTLRVTGGECLYEQIYV